MLPARNRRDFDDIPAEAREALEFVWLERVDEAVAAALEAGNAGGGADGGSAPAAVGADNFSLTCATASRSMDDGDLRAGRGQGHVELAPDMALRSRRGTDIFEDPFAVEFLDDREDYGEERFILIGMAGDRLLVVAYTTRGERTRLISARSAEPFERRQYHEQNK